LEKKERAAGWIFSTTTTRICNIYISKPVLKGSITLLISRGEGKGTESVIAPEDYCVA